MAKLTENEIEMNNFLRNKIYPELKKQGIIDEYIIYDLDKFPENSINTLFIKNEKELKISVRNRWDEVNVSSNFVHIPLFSKNKKYVKRWGLAYEPDQCWMFVHIIKAAPPEKGFKCSIKENELEKVRIEFVRPAELYYWMYKKGWEVENFKEKLSEYQEDAKRILEETERDKLSYMFSDDRFNYFDKPTNEFKNHIKFFIKVYANSEKAKVYMNVNERAIDMMSHSKCFVWTKQKGLKQASLKGRVTTELI